MKIGIALLAIPVVLASCSWHSGRSAPPVRTVARVDLARYVGKWYEVARYPNRFQEGCVASTAIYTLLPDGRVEVVNRCREGSPDGPERSVRGKARVVDPDTNARLKVTFFWPFSGDYWILGLGPEYEYAVVGTPSRKYLWILSRTPELPEKAYREAVAIAREQGFDPERIERSPQGDGGS